MPKTHDFPLAQSRWAMCATIRLILLVLVCIILVGGRVQAQTTHPLEVVDNGLKNSDPLCFSPNRRWFLATGSDELQIWDVASGQLLRTLSASDGSSSDLPIYSAVFSPDSRHIVAGLYGAVVIVDVRTGKQIRLMHGHSDMVLTEQYSPNGKILATASSDHDHTVILWNPATGKRLRTLRGSTRSFGSVSFSPDGKTLATSSWDDRIRLWDVQTGRLRKIWFAHGPDVAWVQYSPDGRTLYSGDSFQQIKVWDAASGRQIKTLTRATDGRRVLELSPNCKMLVQTEQIASDKNTYLLMLSDPITGHVIKRLSKQREPLAGGVFSPDSRLIATMNFAADNTVDDKITLWNTKTSKAVSTLQGHSAQIDSLSVSPDGHRLAFASWNGKFKLWDSDARQVQTILTHDDESVNLLSFSPDHRLLASATERTVQIWHAVSGKLLRTLPGTHTASAEGAAFSPDSKTIACINQDQIRLYRIADGQATHTFAVKNQWINGVVYSPNGKILCASFQDGTVRLWAMPRGQLIRTLHAEDAFSTIAFSPDGSILAVDGGDDKFKLWQVATGKLLRSFPQDPRTFKNGGQVIPVAFSQDGHWLTGGVYHLPAPVYHVATGRWLRVPQGNHVPFTCAVFLRKRPIVASGNEDGTVKLWHLPDGKLLATLYTFDDHDWAVVGSHGRFDGTPAALSILHYVIGMRPINLSILKDRYQDPGLLAKILGYDTAPLRKVPLVTAANLRALGTSQKTRG